MEEALFRITIASVNIYRDWFGLRFCLAIDIAVKILTLIKLEVEAGQGSITLLELHFVNVTVNIGTTQ